MKTAVAIVVALTALAVSACASSGAAADAGSGNSAAPKPSGKLTVYAAASLTESFNTIATDFKAAHPGTDLAFQFGSSGDLSAQINQGAPADVFAAASTKTMDAVVDAGNAVEPQVFAVNTAEIAVAPGNPKGIRTLTDLTGSGVSVAVCVATAPCGSLALQLFGKAGLTVAPTATPKDVKATLALVQSGEVDAAIVYVSDVISAGHRVDGVEIPSASNATTKYPIAVLKDSGNGRLAAAFVAYVKSDPAQKLLATQGFSAP